jgi:hypothetical protein
VTAETPEDIAQDLRVHAACGALQAAIQIASDLGPGYEDARDYVLLAKMAIARGPGAVSRRQLAEQNAFEIAWAFRRRHQRDQSTEGRRGERRVRATLIVDVVSAFKAKRSGTGWIATCPSHEDGTASLKTDRGDNGGWVLHCHAGCATESVVTAAGLTMADLQGERSERRIDAEYSYVDAAGRELFQVVRYDPKDFRQRRNDPATGEWTWSTRGVEKVVYRLDQLQGKAVTFIVEGERDVHTLEGLDLPATCNPGGTGKWTDKYTAQLVAAGVKRVGIIPDNDDAGRSHAEQVAASCRRAGLEVRVIVLDGLAAKGDVSDWLSTNSKDDLLALARGSTAVAATATADIIPFAGRGVRLTAADTVTMRAVKWVWDLTGQDGWIPAGCLSLIAGREGIGKSLFAVQTQGKPRGRPFEKGNKAGAKFLPGNQLGLTHGHYATTTPRELLIRQREFEEAVLADEPEPPGALRRAQIQNLAYTQRLYWQIAAALESKGVADFFGKLRVTWLARLDALDARCQSKCLRCSGSGARPGT